MLHDVSTGPADFSQISHFLFKNSEPENIKDLDFSSILESTG